MKLKSSSFDNNGEIPSKYTCDGENVSPPLTISDVPDGAESLVLIMDDPDAVEPTGKVWDHWVVWNIPADTNEIPEGEEPEGVHGTGTGGNRDYYGPCPPDREHTYHFKLYALDTELDLSSGSEKSDVEDAMKGHVVEDTELLGRYERN